MKTLQQIVDEQPEEGRTDKGLHGYLPIYEKLFDPLRETTLPILEIGVGEGGSLKLWERYFEHSRSIYGIDILPPPYCGARVVVFHGNAADASLLALLGSYGPFALIVDDGGHRGDEQEIAFRALWPTVAPGGLYVIEDLHASYVPDFAPSVIPFLKSLVDAVNVDSEFAHIASIQFYPKLFVAQKRGAAWVEVTHRSKNEDGTDRVTVHHMPLPETRG